MRSYSSTFCNWLSVSQDSQKVGKPGLAWFVKELAKRRSPAIPLFFHNQWPETGHSNQLKKLKLHEEVKKEIY